VNGAYDTMTILRIAKAYYVDGLSQQEIANRENIHRTQISRLLKQARDEGYVDIRISAPDQHDADELARALTKKLGLSEVVVTPSLDTGSDDEALAFFAARWLETKVSSVRKIGIGVGQTMYRIAEQLTEQRTDPAVDVYALAGWSGSDNRYLQGAVITDNLSRALHGIPHYSNFPLIADTRHMSPEDRDRLRKIQETWKSLDMAVFSIGESLSMDYTYFEELSAMPRGMELQKAFDRENANILGNIFYEDGTQFTLPEPYLLTSMDLSTLSSLPEVICVAGGPAKVHSILSAAKNHYIKTLVTDKATAALLLEECQDTD